MGMFICDISGIGGVGWGELSLGVLLPLKYVDVADACSQSAPADNSTLLGALDHPFWLVSIADNWFLDVLALPIWVALLLVIAIPIVWPHLQPGVVNSTPSRTRHSGS